MGTKETTVSMVKTMEEMQQAYDIRRKVFVTEGGESEEIEFDGNDFCAAHLLAYWKGEPVATMRFGSVWPLPKTLASAILGFFAPL